MWHSKQNVMYDIHTTDYVDFFLGLTHKEIRYELWAVPHSAQDVVFDAHTHFNKTLI